ncbi:hypothetical protein GL263_07495 [Streptomyces durbertensis]|uniref:Uncharacterized protein n=1 Tax=Streptomyces durbertensis TaxID=2448886 RepID=A0ABR6EDK0_9ACTN|nr:hypothetical protein [Streptomyces durbertensis]MBB1243406.1 hypothetical protein [Streptomyces durbertensis]
MKHLMRAEYRSNGDVGAEATVKTWHMVRGEGTTALCGRDLDERSATRSEDAWGAMHEPFCHTCGAVYLREVP